MKLLISFLISIATYNITYCQTTNRPDYVAMAARETAMMKQQLKLDTIQTKKVALLNNTFFEKLAATRSLKDSLPLRKQKIAQLNQDRMASLQEVFTPDQFAKYKEDMEAMQAKVRQVNTVLSNKHHLVTPKKDTVVTKQ